MYQFKITKIEDNAEWYTPDPMSGAGPTVKGSTLKRRIYIEVSNGVTKLYDAEILVNEPFTDAGYADAINAYSKSLPVRNVAEGTVAVVDTEKVDLYRADVKVYTKTLVPIKEEPIIKDPIIRKQAIER